jgi:hypothetical protein
MKPSDDLFKLIRSLTKSEKGYFRKFTARHVVGDENTYMTLFDAIDAQQEYDEEAIKNSYSDRAFVRRLPALKNYLYSLILRSLRAYYAEASASRKLRGLLDDYSILREKRLYDQAVKVLGRAKKIAEHYELFRYMLIIEEYERQIQIMLFSAAVPLDDIEASMEREKNAIERVLEVNRYDLLGKKLFKTLSETGTQRGETVPEYAELFRSNPLLKDENLPQAFIARSKFYHVRSTYAYYCGDYEESYRNIRALFDLFESRPEFIANHTDSYINILSNLIGICCVLSRETEALLYLDKLRQLPLREYGDDMERFIMVRGSELALFLKMGRFDELRVLLPTLQLELEKLEKDLSPYYRRYFFYHIGWAWFTLGNISEALSHINEVLNGRGSDIREDLYCFAKIINLLIHYDLGNIDLLQYEVLSTCRYLAKRQRNYTFETLVLRFIKRAIAVSPEELRQEFIALRAELVQLRDDPSEHKAFDFFYFIPWLDSKIERIPLESAVARSLSGNHR